MQKLIFLYRCRRCATTFESKPHQVNDEVTPESLAPQQLKEDFCYHECTKGVPSRGFSDYIGFVLEKGNED